MENTKPNTTKKKSKFFVVANYKIRSFGRNVLKGLKIAGHGIATAFKNETFLYILKRLLMAFLTLIAIVAAVTALMRFIPETKLYSLQNYHKLLGAGKEFAEAYKNKQLFIYGRVTIDGKRVSVLQNIGTYIYYLLPIYKVVPVKWDETYTVVLDSWKGFVYLGRSINFKWYVKDELQSRIGISFAYSIITLLISYAIAYPLGIAMAKKPGGTVDKIGNAFLVLNYAIPTLIFYLIVNQMFGDPKIFGKGGFGYLYDETNPVVTLIPAILAMVFLSIPGISLWVRRFMLDELSSDYVKFARSKGLSENRIMYTHVLRNACVPLVRSIPGSILGAIVGGYYVETIWGIPGTGRMLMVALQASAPDIPVVQGLTIVYSAISMVSFLLGDIITVIFDPRIKITNR